MTEVEYEQRRVESQRNASRKYYEKSKELVRERARIRYAENAASVREQARARHRRHPLSNVVASAKQRAKKQGVPFDITPEDIHLPDVCPVLGIPLIRGWGIGRTDNSPALDRVVPELGYVKGNVQIISDRANRIKNDGTAEEHRLIAEYIEQHTQEKQNGS